MDEKLQEWLKSLKVGDKVAVRTSSFGSIQYSFNEILKITPKGALRIKGYDSCLFKDGSANSGGKWNSTHYSLVPITEELKARLHLAEKRARLARFDGWSKLEEPVINAIYDLIPGI